MVVLGRNNMTSLITSFAESWDSQSAIHDDEQTPTDKNLQFKPKGCIEFLRNQEAPIINSSCDDEHQQINNNITSEHEEDDEFLISSVHSKTCKELVSGLQDINVEESRTECLYRILESKKDKLLRCGASGTFLHILVSHFVELFKATKTSQASHLIKALPIIIPWILVKHPDLKSFLTTEKGLGKCNVLEFASEKCVDVAYCILNLLLDDKTKRQIEGPCHKDSASPCSMNNTYLLCAFRLAKGDDGWCPHRDNEVLKFHKQLESTLKEAVMINCEVPKTCIYYALDGYIDHPDCEAVIHLVHLSGVEVIMDSRNSCTALLIAIRKFKETKGANRECLKQLKEIIRLIVRLCPQALYATQSEITVYKELLSYDSLTLAEDADGRDLRAELVEVLKQAIIGDPNTAYSEKLKNLYPSDSSVKTPDISLDLGHSKPIGARYVDAIIKQKSVNLEFETALSYIDLPPRKTSYTSTTQIDKDTDILETYGPLFQFLKEKKVRKIFRMAVNDLTCRPHTDEMIYTLAKDFSVEYWEWKKLDMNIEIIHRAAPRVKTVSLHSSGSYSALQGWACETGLVILQDLTTVYVTIHRGVETEKDLENYKNNFKEALHTRFKDKGRDLIVETRLESSVAEQAENVDQKTNRALAGQAKLNHAWINHMDTFVDGLQNFAHDMKSQVKVVLIDDGIDLVTLKSQVAGGRSFSDSDQEHTSYDNYYVEAGPHGTVMASLISQMCPMAELYIAKIVPLDGSTIPPNAAAKALYWAIEKKADIISMSWTFSKEINGADEFKIALAEAYKRGILLFSSLREKEDGLLQSYYPVSLPGVFRIGSASRSGNMMGNYSGDSKHAEFILPGQEVLHRSGSEIKEIHGSSVATALAAGLAALILFCADLTEKSDETNGSNPCQNQKLRSEQNMRALFHNMSRNSNGKKYPEVQRFLTLPDKDMTLSEIQKIINSLMGGMLT